MIKIGTKSVIKEVLLYLGFWRCFQCKAGKAPHASKHLEILILPTDLDPNKGPHLLLGSEFICKTCYAHNRGNIHEKFREFRDNERRDRVWKQTK